MSETTLVSSLGVADRVESLSRLVALLPVSVIDESVKISELCIVKDLLDSEFGGTYDVFHPQEFVNRS